MAHRNLPVTLNGDIYVGHLKNLNPARVNDTGSGGMHDVHIKGYLHGSMRHPQLTNTALLGLASKAFQRSISDGETALSCPDPTSPTKATAGAQTNSHSRRRQSIREPKAIISPGSLQNSPSKRYVMAYSHYSVLHAVE